MSPVGVLVVSASAVTGVMVLAIGSTSVWSLRRPWPVLGVPPSLAMWAVAFTTEPAYTATSTAWLAVAVLVGCWAARWVPKVRRAR